MAAEDLGVHGGSVDAGRVHGGIVDQLAQGGESLRLALRQLGHHACARGKKALASRW